MDGLLELTIRFGWLAALVIWLAWYFVWHIVAHRLIGFQPGCRCFHSTAHYGYYAHRAKVARGRKRAAATRRKAHL